MFYMLLRILMLSYNSLGAKFHVAMIGAGQSRENFEIITFQNRIVSENLMICGFSEQFPTKSFNSKNYIIYYWCMLNKTSCI